MGEDVGGDSATTFYGRCRGVDARVRSYRQSGQGVDVRLLDWLNRVERERASDLILSSGASARMRVAGELRELPGPTLSREELLALFEPELDASAQEELKRHGSIDR